MEAFNTLRGIAVGAALTISLSGNAAESLNVKPGLWEIEAETDMSGMPPLPKEVLENLPAEQRAALEAAMKAQADRGPIRETTRECVTKEDLQNPFNAESVENCEQIPVTSTSTRQEVRLVCSGERSGTGFLRIDTPTPETMNGTFELKITDGADTLTIAAKMQGKWLGEDCGDEAD